MGKFLCNLFRLIVIQWYNWTRVEHSVPDKYQVCIGEQWTWSFAMFQSFVGPIMKEVRFRVWRESWMFQWCPAKIISLLSRLLRKLKQVWKLLTLQIFVNCSLHRGGGWWASVSKLEFSWRKSNNHSQWTATKPDSKLESSWREFILDTWGEVRHRPGELFWRESPNQWSF